MSRKRLRLVITDEQADFLKRNGFGGFGQLLDNGEEGSLFGVYGQMEFTTFGENKTRSIPNVDAELITVELNHEQIKKLMLDCKGKIRWFNSSLRPDGAIGQYGNIIFTKEREND